MSHEEGRREKHTDFWWRNMKERIKLEDLGEDRKTVLRWILNKQGRMTALDYCGST